MSPADLASDIREFCVENANPELVEKYVQHFGAGFEAYGLSLEQIEDVVMSILDEGAGYKLIRETCRILVRSSKYEETSFAILLMKAFEKSFTPKTFEEFEFWFMFGVKHLAHADVICAELLTPMWKNGLIGFEQLSGWKTAGNKLQRRSVPILLSHLIRPINNTSGILQFAESLSVDESPEVIQGVSGLLYEIWKNDPVSVKAFLTGLPSDKLPEIKAGMMERKSKKEKQAFS
jgi:hypothetical protein